MPVEGTVTMRGVRIIFRNFEGKEGKYNQAGSRSFGVILPKDVAMAMLADGWNVKYLEPREEEEEETEPQPWLPVQVAYDKGRPPRISMISSRGKTNLDEKMVETLDWADITNVDLIVRPYNWDVNGKSGVKAYLQTMFVTVEEDELERDYAEMNTQ